MIDSKTKTESVYVGLGTNLGNRGKILDRAIKWLGSHPGIDLVKHTAALETEPWGISDQPPFLNMVAELRTSLTPLHLLGELKRGEKELGRKHSSHWGPREIDLDILLYGDRIIESKNLVIPHPHLLNRSFVISQLVELAPRVVHPVEKKRIADFRTPRS